MPERTFQLPDLYIYGFDLDLEIALRPDAFTRRDSLYYQKKKVNPLIIEQKIQIFRYMNVQ